MPDTKYSPLEVRKRGEAIFEERIQPSLTPADQGKFVVIDIETGEYDIAEDDLYASKQVLSRHPNALLYGLRIGYPAAYKLGAQHAMEVR